MAMLILLAIVFLMDITSGQVSIGLSDVINSIFNPSNSQFSLIVNQFRLPKAINALIAGVGLSISGLAMQSFFRNPLAGPYILGVSSGSGLMVALVFMMSSILPINIGNLILGFNAVMIASVIGSVGILLLLMLIAWRISQPVTLLLAGVIIGQVCGAITEFISINAQSESLKNYIKWGSGSFANTNIESLFYPAIIIISGFLFVWRMHKDFDLYEMGQDYAVMSGINPKAFSFKVIMVCGILTGIITALCGPLSFIGLSVPLMVRMLMKNSFHSKVIPIVAIGGGIFALFSDFISSSLSINGIIPVNTVTTLLGAPVFIWVLLKNRNL